ncbi:hypothetical protein [Nocardiopsis algeriensis]|uniref:Uncharacterized protein n=1 Tax=Nocardiopsis algeriensis TaxID=1478215 RepID=A0A841ITF0_9ACTN|nr:hypothetical protein [Nocardiopsis algeriensis]MBB6122189.1 hypothetical protein [Nocardiopsis algeriensis]
MPIRCTCAAAAERARELYGHLENQDVWITFSYAPNGCYRGRLRISKDRPGYILLDRGEADYNRVGHIDQIVYAATHEEHTRARAIRCAQSYRT